MGCETRPQPQTTTLTTQQSASNYGSSVHHHIWYLHLTTHATSMSATDKRAACDGFRPRGARKWRRVYRPVLLQYRIVPRVVEMRDIVRGSTEGWSIIPAFDEDAPCRCLRDPRGDLVGDLRRAAASTPCGSAAHRGNPSRNDMRASHWPLHWSHPLRKRSATTIASSMNGTFLMRSSLTAGAERRPMTAIAKSPRLIGEFPFG